jgi:DNA-binding PadR family transcriptional regulator
LKILAVLAASKEMEQYQLPKETGLSYRTILRTLKPLESKDRLQIRLLRTEPSEKGGKEKKIYAITLAGLLRVLKESVMRNVVPEDIDHFRRIINAHPELLLSFAKWPLFQQAGLEEKFLTYVLHGVLDFYLKSASYLLSGVPNLKHETARTYIDQLVLLRPFMYERERGRPLNAKFLQVCKQDNQLREFIDQQLALQQEQCRRLSHDVAEWKKLKEKKE